MVVPSLPLLGAGGRRSLGRPQGPSVLEEPQARPRGTSTGKRLGAG